MLQFLMYLAETSLRSGVAILLIIALTPLLSRFFSPQWRRWVWALIILHMCFGQVKIFPPIVKLPVPEILVETEYQGTEGFYRDRNLHYYSGANSGGSFSRKWLGEDGKPEISEYSVTIHMPHGDKRITDNYWVRTKIDPMGPVGSGEYVKETVIHYPTVICAIWFVVAAGTLLFTLRRYRLFRNKAMEHSRPASEHDLKVLENQKVLLSLADKKMELELRRCSVAPSPMLMGFRKHVILLPEELPDSALETTLAHELTHLRYGDPLLLLLCAIARSIHWFNPLMWVMMRHVRQTIEECCDHALLMNRGTDARRAYGRAILDQITAQKGLSGLTTGFSGDKKSIFVRFKAIMDERPKRDGTALIILAGTMVIFSGGLVACEAQPPTSDYAAYTGELRAMLTVPLEENDRVLSFDPYEDQAGLRNTDTGLQTLPLADNLSVEDTDYYQILNKFEPGGRYGTQKPVWYTLVVDAGVIREIIPGDWFAIPERDIPTTYYVPLDWTQDFFDAFAVGDYETMKSFCTEECVNDGVSFEENGAFWFETARVLTAEVLPTQSGNGVKMMECLVDGQPTEGSALEKRDGPYVLWLYCVQQPDESWKIDMGMTGSMLIH